jgi:preprotein translocase subunit YajC
MNAIVLLLFLVAGWMLLIRPQQQRIRAQRALIASLAVGDEVVTAGGIVGTIRALDDRDARIEVGPGIILTFLRPAVSRRLEPGEAGMSAGDGSTSAGEAGMSDGNGQPGIGQAGTSSDRAASGQAGTGSDRAANGQAGIGSQAGTGSDRAGIGSQAENGSGQAGGQAGIGSTQAGIGDTGATGLAPTSGAAAGDDDTDEGTR